jgi:predicted Na+-dependent transporter
MTSITTNPTLAALTGVLLALPFVAMNAIVGNRIEPFFSMIRPGIHTSPLEYVLLFIVVLLIPVGAFVAARPLFQKRVDGKRRFHAVNAILATLLCILFVAVSAGLGSDIYRCDILRIPNCD